LAGLIISKPEVYSSDGAAFSYDDHDSARNAG
jgi:hypothetical protein